MTPQLFLGFLAKALAALVIMFLVVMALYVPDEPIRFTPIIDASGVLTRAVEMLR